jgi:hypothetical protein
MIKSFKGHMKDDAFSASATSSLLLTSSAQLGNTLYFTSHHQGIINKEDVAVSTE